MCILIKYLSLSLSLLMQAERGRCYFNTQARIFISITPLNVLSAQCNLHLHQDSHTSRLGMHLHKGRERQIALSGDLWGEVQRLAGVITIPSLAASSLSYYKCSLIVECMSSNGVVT